MTASRVTSVYTSIIITLVPAILTVALRFYPKRIRKIKPWWDDWIALFALVPAILYDAAAFFLISKGLGLHLPDLPVPIEEAQMFQLLVQEIQEHTYTVAIGAAQLSLLALYWRIFGTNTNAMILILILTGFVSVWVVARIFIAVFQCYPPRYFWDKSIDGTCTVNPSTFFLGSVASHLVIDIILMILPASQINRLLLPTAQKVALTVMFMFGVTICVASIMMIVQSVHYDSYAADFMWNCTPVVNWSAIEIHLSIMAACLPILRPALKDMGGWCRHHFSSAKGRGQTDNSTLRLGSLESERRKPGSDSTHNLADTTSRSGHSAIYTAREDAETRIVSKGRADDPADEECPSEGKILVKYEVNLGFSDRDS